MLYHVCKNNVEKSLNSPCSCFDTTMFFSSLHFDPPVRVHKRHAVVRFMFFSSEDVKWFKPVQLRTKHGLIGEIREPLGTKGHFKCSFNDFIKQNDTICMHLYKRQHPKWEPELWE